MEGRDSLALSGELSGFASLILQRITRALVMLRVFNCSRGASVPTSSDASRSAVTQQMGKVLDIRIRTTPQFNPTHFRLDGAWSGKPACATVGWWAFDGNTAAGKALLATLLTAQATGKPIVAWGHGDCDLRSDMETTVQVGLSQ